MRRLMFSISYIFRKSRSSKNPEKDGMFCLTLTERIGSGNGKSSLKRANVITGIKSRYGEITPEIRPKLSRLIRLAYCIIEKLDSEGRSFNLSDVMKRLRLAIEGNPSMDEAIKRADTDFPLRSDLVSIGNEFKSDFKFICPTPLPQYDTDTDSLAGFLLKKSEDFKIIDKLATSRSFAYTSNSIDKFGNGEEIKLSQVDKAYLNQYSNWLKATGVTESTQSFYLRTLRSALNYASEEKGIIFEPILFEGLNTKIYRSNRDQEGSGIDGSLISRISTLIFPDNKETELVRDMFMFGFYCQGMELSDLLNLKKENVNGQILLFKRRQKGKLKQITLDKAAIDIIKKYEGASETYLFPLKEMYRSFLYYSISERVRKNMKKIGERVGRPNLSFGANIMAWKQIISQLDLSSILQQPNG